MTTLRALVLDVFGTAVDWRSSVLAEASEVEARTGVRADWGAVVDDWRRAYQPSLLEARRAGTWRDLDALHRESLVRRPVRSRRRPAGCRARQVSDRRYLSEASMALLQPKAAPAEEVAQPALIAS